MLPESIVNQIILIRGGTRLCPSGTTGICTYMEGFVYLIAIKFLEKWGRA